MAILKRIILFLFPVFVIAQPDSGSVSITMDVLDATDLNQNVVVANKIITSASRKPEEVENIPFTTYIITAEQIRNRGYSSLVDVLKDLPGIKVSQPGSAIHGETFLMRGMFGNYYVKILVDDLPIQPSATSGMPIASQLPIAQAESIEVLYGPAAAIYGADAMAGVINIKTKRAEKLHLVEADGSVGFPGNWRFDATIGGKFGKNNRVWNYMFYGGLNNFNNMPIIGEKYSDQYDPSAYVMPGDESIYLGSDYYQGSKTQPAFSFLPKQSQKFGFRIGHKRLTLGLDFGNREIHSAIGSNPIYRAYHDPNTRFGEQIVRVFGSYKIYIGDWLSQTNLQFLTYEIDPSSKYITIDNPTGFEGNFYSYGASADLYFEQFLSRQFNKHWSLLAGVTVQFSGNQPQFDFFTTPFEPSSYKYFSTKASSGFEYLDNLGLGPFNFLNIGAVADASYKNDNWSVHLGLRGDYREFYGLVFNPRFGSVYKINPENRIRFTASTAFRPPSSYLVSNGILSQDQGGMVIGVPFPNPDLNAEKLLNVDGGYEWDISKYHQFRFTAFYHVNKNLITKTSLALNVNGEEIDYYGYLSDENSTSQLFGGQFLHVLQFELGKHKIRSEASILYAKGNEVLPFNRGNLDNYRQQPEFSGKWLLELSTPYNLHFMLRTQAFSKWSTRSVVVADLDEILVAPGFYTIDFQVRYVFDKGKEVYLMIDNLTNNAYFGIGATGGAGFVSNRVVFEDLFFNPQMLRVVKIGARINIF